MEYQKTSVNNFAGVDVNLRPETVPDPVASDIENLRFDKLGYLVNRNGTDTVPVSLTRTVFGDIQSILRPIGTMGMSEFVLKKPWGVGSGEAAVAPYDDATLLALNVDASATDRLMVYAIRIPANYESVPTIGPYNTQNYPAAPANHYTWRYKSAYILVPLQGKNNWRDAFAFAPNGVPMAGVGYNPEQDLPSLYSTIGTRMILRADDKYSSMQMYAPQRWLGMHNVFTDNSVPKDQNWLEHYVTIIQYRDTIVSADRINGDVQIVDEYSEVEYSEEPRHRFTLRENTLPLFDIDDVVVDFGLNSGGFNDGVEAPMALYKFFLPRKRLEPTRDNYSAYYAAAEESPRILAARGDVRTYKITDQIGSFIATEYWYSSDDRLQVCAISFNTSEKFSFTMSETGEEYDDIFGELTLNNPDIKEEGQAASDIYRWDDFKIKYYPASGLDQAGNFLRDKDRTWDKTSSGSPKLIKLKTKKDIEQEIPLGVWRYRFIWYMGNGEYSAPSAELVVPDILFSGLTDADVISSLGSYKRPFGFTEYKDAERTSLNLSGSSFHNVMSRMQGLRIFDNTGALTAYGTNFVKIKEELFYPEHAYAALSSSTSGLSWPANWATESKLAKGQLTVISTMMFADDSATLQGVAVETATSKIEVEVGTYKKTEYYSSNMIQMMVPLFSQPGKGSWSYNSVFTDYGVPRTVWQNRITNSDPLNVWYNANRPAYQIVFEGTQRYGAENPVQSDWVHSDVINSGKGVWFNVVPGPFTDEKNNRPDDEVVAPPQTRKYYENRNMTVFRGTRQESDRINFFKDNLPVGVTSRIVLSGIGEIPLCDFGDPGTWVSHKSHYPNRGDDNLGYDTNRSFTEMLGGANTSLYAYDTGYFPANVDGNPVQYPNFFKVPGMNYYPGKISITNLRVRISGIGERLTIPEQLSMYCPASLLFDAPHVKLSIPLDRIPRRARQLMIFRTRASHDNAWQPHEYGLVKSIDIKRTENGVLDYAVGTTALDFLDDVKNEDMDFSYNVEDYDGLTTPLKSRFCLPLNERVFYSNFIEAYRPRTPRTSVYVLKDAGVTNAANHYNKNVGANTEVERLWSRRIVDVTIKPDLTPTTNITKRYLLYFLTYADAARSVSLPGYLGVIDRGDLATADNTKKRVMLYCLPSAYNSTVDECAIYRVQSNVDPATLQIRLGASRTAAAPAGKMYLVVQGTVEYHGKVYYPKDVIKTAAAPDSGVPTAYHNQFVNAYLDDTTKNRPAMGSYCDPILLDITDAALNGSDYMEKIGTIVPENEGIFYDDDLPSLGRLGIKQIDQSPDDIISGLRWSEPYQPNKIKLASIMEVRAGDGDQITGMTQLYGNIVVLKERSMHRLAVQGSSVPVSRVDEISNNIGCIAPNTAIVVNNTLYFLSWAGFFAYDNNVLKKADGSFSEELQIRLRSAQGTVPNPAIRDASCGWNPTYRELYLNIPVMSTTSSEGDYSGTNKTGITLTDNKSTRSVRGITYVINIDNGLVTKYRYMDDSSYHTDPTNPLTVGFNIVADQRSPRVQGRLYYANTLGQMRSAEILPTRTFNPLNPTKALPGNASLEYLQSTFYIESPTKDLNGLADKQKDEFVMYTQVSPGNYAQVPAERYVRVYWRSKAWTLDDKTMLKRVRKVFTHISASAEPVVIRGLVHTSPEGPTMTVDTQWEYTYADTRFSGPPYPSATGELLAIPTEAAGASSSASQNRGERHTFEIEGGGGFQVEYFGFYWKPINTYER